jgi:membrane protease YdiL (CAAX protease family)
MSQSSPQERAKGASAVIAINEMAAGRGLGRKAALVQVVCLVCLIEAVMWLVPFFSNPSRAYGAAAIVISLLLVYCATTDPTGPDEAGFRLDNFFRVLADLSPALLVFVAAVLAIGYLYRTLNIGSPRFYSMLAAVPLWALLQQYMLLAFVNRRLRLLVPGASTILTALLFGLLHLPNPVLAVCCALGGYVWAREYERRPNLLANAVTHAVASAFLANSLPHWLLKNMVVGYNYFLK